MMCRSSTLAISSSHTICIVSCLYQYSHGIISVAWLCPIYIKETPWCVTCHIVCAKEVVANKENIRTFKCSPGCAELSTSYPESDIKFSRNHIRKTLTGHLSWLRSRVQGRNSPHWRLSPLISLNTELSIELCRLGWDRTTSARTASQNWLIRPRQNKTQSTIYNQPFEDHMPRLLLSNYYKLLSEIIMDKN